MTTTARGIRCGNRMAHGADRVYHPSVTAVKECYNESARIAFEEEQAKSELEAEARNERWFEERGGSEDDPREAEAMYMEELARETADIQAKERKDDEAAYLFKMERDEALMAGRVLDTMTGSHGRDMASERQVKYALDLLRTRMWPDAIDEADLRNMERRAVSKLIDGLKSAPSKPDAADEQPEVGMYIDRETDSVFRFYFGQRSGRVLAKRLMGKGDGWGYQYVGSAQKAMAKHKLVRMPIEEAKAWGKMTGTCCVCARRLDVPESVEAGIGPVCARKGGWE